jgi:hypothetical protein
VSAAFGSTARTAERSGASQSVAGWRRRWSGRRRAGPKLVRPRLTTTERGVEQRRGLPDGLAIPQAAVLFLKRHEHPVVVGAGGPLLHRDRHVADVAADRRGDLAERVGEGRQPRACQLVQLADVPVVGQRRRGDLGDVVRVGKGLELIAGRQGDITFADLPPR